MKDPLNIYSSESTPTPPVNLPSTHTLLYRGGTAVAIIMTIIIMISVLFEKLIDLIETLKK